VDWYPWGKEAFDKARAENKPVFLSIGYSTCHWCHVMERESFEDDDVARLMNETFVSIKVDREERPDIDDYYMTVCQVMTGTGGWPLTVIMTPERKPFFATTYIPKESKYGRTGLMQLIPGIGTAWRNQRSDIVKSTEVISEHLRQLTVNSTGREMNPGIIKETYHKLRSTYDPSAGGFGNAPKFPTPQNVLFLLRYFIETADAESLKMVEHTLKSMRMGGIYDQIGFGFHRYSTDSHWRLPHFEKMLYDQALLIIVYNEAFQITRNVLYRDTVHEIITYVLRDMQSQEGVFYSAEDADSEGQEGKYYIWTEPEIRKILDPPEYDLIVRTFNIENDGNYEDEVSRARNGHNLLYRSHTDETLAREFGISIKAFNERLHAAREKMFAYRTERIRPQMDTKVLCDWNGLMIAALSKAARLFGDAKFKHAAMRAADFILANMRSSDGHLFHRYIDGEVAVTGFLDDYAFLIWGLTELYQSTFEPRYLKTALELSEKSCAIFGDEEHGAFFSTPADNELPVRSKKAYDGAIPSGNSIMAFNLIRLGRITGQHDLEDKASTIFDSFGNQIQNQPLSHIYMLAAFKQLLSPAPNIVIYGDKESDATMEMLRVIHNSRRVDSTTLMLPAGEEAETSYMKGFTKGLRPVDGRTTAYVCQGYKCDKPATDIKELARIIEPRTEDASG